MQITRTLTCELPFILNLPENRYTVQSDRGCLDLAVIHNLNAIHVGQEQFAIVPQDQCPPGLDGYHRQRLRTVLQHTTSVEVLDADILMITDDQVIEDIASGVVREMMGSGSDGIAAEARRRWNALDSVARSARRRQAGIRRFARTLIGPGQEDFLAAVNTLVRLYMDRFGDFFVEEVTLHQLSGQTPLMGIYVQVNHGGELVDHYGIVGRIPPIMRQPWQPHPAAQVIGFQNDLASGMLPNPVNLLCVRARAFLQRGAYRSALIEASAAFDLCLLKKIRDGMRAKGKTEAEIEKLLDENRRYEDRAKKALKEATGKSAPEVDNILWESFRQDRKQRGNVAHSETEPTQRDAEQAVENTIQLIQKIAELAT